MKRSSKFTRKEFDFCKIMLERKYLKSKIELFKEHKDVLNFKEKKELKKLQKKWNSQIIIGTTNKVGRR